MAMKIIKFAAIQYSVLSYNFLFLGPLTVLAHFFKYTEQTL